MLASARDCAGYGVDLPAGPCATLISLESLAFVFPYFKPD
jgi:hypothetical protein